MRYAAVVIGVSAGGIEALQILLSALPASFPLPIAIVQHRDPRADGFLAEYLDRMSSITVSEAEDKEPFCAGHAYLAPAGYHLHLESDRSLSLSVDPRVNYSCPSIDVLFESAADAFAESLIGIVLTGAMPMGRRGSRRSKRAADWLLCRIHALPRQRRCPARRWRQRQSTTWWIWCGLCPCCCG